MRSVLSVRNYVHPNANGTGGTNVLELECGHSDYRKFSQGIPKRVACKECESLRDGAISLRGLVKETWDAESQMPKYETITQKEADNFFKMKW